MTAASPEEAAGPQIPVHLVHLYLCDPCLDGAGGECHTPGCSLWMHLALTQPVRESQGVTVLGTDRDGNAGAPPGQAAYEELAARMEKIAAGREAEANDPLGDRAKYRALAEQDRAWAAELRKVIAQQTYAATETAPRDDIGTITHIPTGATWVTWADGQQPPWEKVAESVTRLVGGCVKIRAGAEEDERRLYVAVYRDLPELEES